MDIFAELEKLRRSHHVCDEDCWYSCPKSGENCMDNEVGPLNDRGSCDCGADKHNETLDGIIEWLKGPITHIVDIPFTLEDFNKAIQYVVKNKEANK